MQPGAAASSPSTSLPLNTMVVIQRWKWKLFSFRGREKPEAVFRYQVTVTNLQDLLQWLLDLQACSQVFAKEPRVAQSLTEA